MPVTSPPRARVNVRAIARADMPAVSEFLHEHLDGRVPPAAWTRAVDVPWPVEAPNCGFMLLADERVVGVHLAFYADRAIDGRRERFCNLGAFCVVPEHRFQALRLLKALLAQDGYHFTDLSPSGNVVGLNTRLGFQFLDTTTAVMPNVPWPSWPGRTTITSDPAAIEAALSGRDLEIYRDHAAAAAARHVLLARGDERCHVIFRKDRRKGLPLFASVLHVSNPDLFHRLAGNLGRHLLLRHGAAATLVERAVIGRPPRRSFAVDSPRRKMFRSQSLGREQIDLLYSELVCVSW